MTELDDDDYSEFIAALVREGAEFPLLEIKPYSSSVSDSCRTRGE